MNQINPCPLYPSNLQWWLRGPLKRSGHFLLGKDVQNQWDYMDSAHHTEFQVTRKRNVSETQSVSVFMLGDGDIYSVIP
jgi:hypothetical protein